MLEHELKEHLEQLARRKNQLYKLTQGQYALKKEECLRKFVNTERYEELLDIIRVMPPQMSIRFSEIERKLFPDAPYV